MHFQKPVIRDVSQVEDWAHEAAAAQTIPYLLNEETAIAYLEITQAQADAALAQADRETKRSNPNGASGAVSVAMTMAATTEGLRAQAERNFPQPNPELAAKFRQTLAKATDLPRRCQQAASSVPTAAGRGPDQVDTDNIEWYANRYYSLASLEAFRLCRKEFNERRNSPATKAAFVSGAEYMAERQSFSDMDPEKAEIQFLKDDARGAHKERLNQAAQNADQTVRRGVETMVQQYNREIEDDISPAILQNPDIAESELIPKRLSTIRASIGFYMGRAYRDDEGRVVTVPPLIIVCFIHQGRRIAKTMLEPYPAGYPVEQAIDHVDASRTQMRKAVTLMALEIGHPHVTTHHAFHVMGFQEQITTMEAMAHAQLHDLPHSAFRELAQELADQGLPQAAVSLMAHALTNGLPHGARHISNAVGRQPLCDGSQAQAITKAAQQAGLHPQSVAQLAQLIGYAPQALDLEVPTTDPDTVKQVTETAQRLNFPEPAVQRLVKALNNPATVPLTTDQ